MTHSMQPEPSAGLCLPSRFYRTLHSVLAAAPKILVALLFLSVTPALALQHGGGGGGHSSGGGGGHFGGGGGGAHPSGGSHPASSAHPSGGAHAPAPHPSGAPAGAAARPGAPAASASRGANQRAPQPAHVAGPGYVWEATPGYTNRVGPETPNNLGMHGYLWEEGPSTGEGQEKSYFLTTNLMPRSETATQQRAPSASVFTARGGVSPRGTSITMTRRPPPSVALESRPTRVFTSRPPFGFNHRRIFFGGFFPFGFFPGAFFGDCFDFGFDYGYGFGYPYDPCGYGYFYPGYGYYPLGSYYNFTGGVYTATNDMTGPYEAPSEDEAVAPPGAQAPTPGPDITVLYFKDGSSYGVSDYWLENGRLHYVTTYGGANAVDLDLLDVQRTVDENAKQGVKFTLRPPHWKDQEAQPEPNPALATPPQPKS